MDHVYERDTSVQDLPLNSISLTSLPVNWNCCRPRIGASSEHNFFNCGGFIQEFVGNTDMNFSVRAKDNSTCLMSQKLNQVIIVSLVESLVGSGTLLAIVVDSR